MKILVTGTAGFIGFHVAHRLLTDGHSIVGLDNINDYYDPTLKIRRNKLLKEFKKYTFYKVDIAEEKKVEKIFTKEKPDTVIHLAAQAGVRYSLLNPWLYAKSNHIGTLSIFEAARKTGIKRVLYASSSSVYGKNTQMPFKESHTTDTPMSLYAATKKANEVMAHAYNHLFGMDMIGFRFFTVYGPWGRPDMAFFYFIDSIQKDKPVTLYNKGNMWRSFTYIDDVVEALVRFVEKKHKPGHRVYNIGGDSLVKVGDLIKEFEVVLSKKAEIQHQEKHIADVLKTHADTSSLKRAIGFVPKTHIKTGLKNFVEWYLKHEKWLSKLAKAKQ